MEYDKLNILMKYGSEWRPYTIIDGVSVSELRTPLAGIQNLCSF